MSNTLVRVISAIVLIIMVLIFVSIGKAASLSLVFLLGAILVDELCINFLNQIRTGFNYIISQLIFSAAYILLFMFYFQNKIELNSIDKILYFTLALNIVSLIYLFFIPMEKKIFSKYFAYIPWASGVLAFLLIFPVARLFLLDDWKFKLGLLLFINFGMDAGAFISGKFFGKNKLWESVSPKKTVEGLIGGMIISTIIGTIYWVIVHGKPSLMLIVSFTIIALLSQIGDLVQSKIKRQVGIKDSSGLIPGHGGVYDRIDSLVFVTPFFLLLFLKWLPLTF